MPLEAITRVMVLDQSGKEVVLIAARK